MTPIREGLIMKTRTATRPCLKVVSIRPEWKTNSKSLGLAFIQLILRIYIRRTWRTF